VKGGAPTREGSAAVSYELRLLPRVADVKEEEWDALALEDASPFGEFAWLDCLEKAGCVGADTGWLPIHFTLYRDGKLVAVAPAYAKTNSEGEFVFDWSWADLSHRLGVPYYPKLLFAIPFTPATGGRVLVAKNEDRETLTRIVAEASRKWVTSQEFSSAHALFPREGEARTWTEAGYAERYGVQFHWRRDGATTFEEYLGRFNSKHRNQVKRENAQPKKDGVTIETLAANALTPDIVRTMHALYRANVDRFYYGRPYLNLRFFELVAVRFAHRLAWVVAKKDGDIVAGAFNVQKGKFLYGRYWGSLVDLPFLHFNVCYYHGIRHCLEHGIDVFEPGAGGEHKRPRGFLPTVTRSVHWVKHPRLRSALDSFLEREKQGIVAYVNQPGD
jgi:predicted N-acyltransferase